MKTLNLNTVVYVKLTEEGQKIFRHRWDDLRKLTESGAYLPDNFKSVDKNGYSKFMLWDFMNIYGPYMRIGRLDQVIVDNDIFIDDIDLEDFNESLPSD